MAIIDRRGASLSAADPPSATTPNPDLAIKTAVRAATTGANIALAGLQTIDGVALAAGDRILVKDQTDATANGIYTASSGDWTRTIDAANNSQWADGTVVYVNAGTAGTGLAYRLAVADPIVIGTTAMAFALAGGSGFVAEAPNLVLAGPASGPAAEPAFRALLTADLPANGVTNAKLAQMAATTLKGNKTASTANASDLTLADVAAMLGIVGPPQGRLTLTTGTAIPTVTVTAATTVFYTPAVGRYVPLWNGSALVMTDTGGELSQATTDATKSPAAVTTNSNYDVFVWNDAGTMRATRGPAWTSDTARGTGAGTTELDFTTAAGIPLNKNAITNGPAAGRGTYVGTIRSDGSSQINQNFGSAASGGGMATLGVWNAYNQVLIRASVKDTSASWSYTTATVRAANASNNNRIQFVSGLAQHSISVTNNGQLQLANAAGAFGAIGIALDATNAFDSFGLATNSAAVSNIFFTPLAPMVYGPQLGFHFAQATEDGDGSHATTFTGLPLIGMFLM